MIVSGLFRAVAQLGEPIFRRVLARSLALTLAVVVVLSVVLIGWLLPLLLGDATGWWWQALLGLSQAGVLVGSWFLFPAVASAVIGLFLDDIAEVVERRHYPGQVPGRPLPNGAALLQGLRFASLVLLINLVALPFYIAAMFFAGAGFVLALVINGYLFSREYFELVALRHMDAPAAKALRRRHRGRLMGVGMAIAAGFAVPLANLFVPILATAWMVHVFKALQAESKAVS